MSKYKREIATELESLDDNAFDAATDTIKLDIEKAEDVAFTDADKGIVVMAVRDDTPPTAKGANNDYMPLLVDAKGQLYVKNDEYFGGAIFSKRQTSTDARVAVGTVKLRDVVIKNMDAANSVDIGEEKDTIANMRAASFELTTGSSIGFVKVDLATLFIISSVDATPAIIEVIGTKE